MSRARIALLAAVPIVILVLLPLAAYGVDRAMSSGHVARNVSVAGVDVGGTTPEEARQLITAYERRLQTTPAAFVVESTGFMLDPSSVGLEADVDAAITAALEQRSSSFFGGFFPWLSSFGDVIELDLAWRVDPAAVEQQLEAWELQAVSRPAYEGAVEIVDGRVTYDYPAAGFAIDRGSAQSVIAAELASPTRPTTELALTEAEPTLTAADIDDTVTTVERMLSRPAILVDAPRGITFELDRDQLAEAIRIDIVEHSPATIELSLDQDVVARYLAEHQDELEIPAVDAGFDVDIDTGTVTVVPSQQGRTVDPAAATAALFTAATGGLTQPLPYTAGAEPEYSTEDAEAFGPLGLVSEFTTNMPGVNRVHNIQLMADTIDGHVVWPGEEFSINDFVGPRTEAGGYLRDGAIIMGEVTCCDKPANVGGGVSQYGTTIYNAIFFGCYEDLDHTPHSLYISRYPEGREATLGYPAPDVRFRNDSEAPVIIKNSYTNHTITVQFYGNNGGRVCTAEKSDRFNPTSPRTVYEANESVEPGTERVVSKGSGGFSVTVTRVMTMPDGRVIRQPYTHRYRGAVRKIEKHPCDMSASVECPIKVPSVVGLGQGAASDALAAAGFGVAVKTQEVTDPAKAGLVLAQSLNGYQDAGSTVTITVGVDNDPNG
jgi:vancomycin resistance protein YoaR